MFVFKPITMNLDLISEYDNVLYYIIGAVAILSSSTIWVDTGKVLAEMQKKLSPVANIIYVNIGFIFELLSIIAVLVFTTFFLVSNSYNPFIYFRF